MQFTPWREFQAVKRPEVISAWLRGIAKASEQAFRAGASRAYPPASAPGAWPARRSGGLLGSIETEVTASSVTIGTNQRYSKFLREGTSRMARRKMSDNALKEGMFRARLGRWVEWQRL
ncbi:phage gpG-like protein [Bradyrhizobium elkanii]